MLITTIYGFFFTSLSQNAEARSLLPLKEILNIASSRTDKLKHCSYVYASLCDEAAVQTFMLHDNAINELLGDLRTLLKFKHGTPAQLQRCCFILYALFPLVNLSSSDSYKIILGNAGAAELMLEVMMLEDTGLLAPKIKMNLPTAKADAAKLLWNLVFNEENRNRIVRAKGLDLLKALVVTNNDPLKRNVAGILYMFEEKKAAPVPNATAEGKHIMISYNWDNQPMVKKLARYLKEHGYNVWLDIEQMQGSTLGAMADAVENSALVLLCATQKYKDSPNCRLEGEYCLNRKVDFIPLMMQSGYRADGWLGFIMGSRLYHEFIKEEDFDYKIQALLNEIGDRGKSTPGSTVPTAVITPATSVPDPKSKLLSWTNEDMLEWMTKEGIAAHHSAFVQQKIGGPTLAELKDLILEKNGYVFVYFFKNLQEEMKLTTGEMLSISNAIRRL